MPMTPRQESNGVNRTPGREQCAAEGAAARPFDRHRVDEYSVVVVDKHTAEPLGRARATDKPHASDVEMFHAEEKTPDGPAANPHERLVWPWLMAGMGILGLVGVGTVMYVRGGWDAAAVGVTWLGLGYAVSWIVVWAAGLLRAKEEHEIECALDQRHRQEGR
jgi:hypothetical protein